MDRARSYEPVLIGVDAGTSAVKVLAVTATGREIGASARSYGLAAPAPGRVEQDAATVYRATMEALAAVAAEVLRGGATVAAIGLSSAMHGVLCVGADDAPLAPAITWLDRRSGAIAEGWRADGTAAALYPRTGAPMHPMLPVAKLRWLADHEPALVARTRRFVGLKEFFVHRWTGEWLVDWGIASATGMFALEPRAWDPQALALAGIDATRLAQPVAPSTTLAMRPEVARELALSGPPPKIVLGSSDGALATIGAGAMGFDAALTLGTSGAVRTLRAAPALDPAGRTFCYCADDARFVAGGATNGAGAALDWIFALLLADVPRAERFAAAERLAAAVPPGAAGCTVLPFLAGERAPYWNASLRGTIAGLDLSHDRSTILRAAIEGVAFGVYAVAEVMRETSGNFERLLLTGGLTRSPLVRAIVAGVFGLPAAQPHVAESAAFGAALVAAAATGLIGDAVEAASASGTDAAFFPAGADAEAYRPAYARYRRAVAAQLEQLAAANDATG